MRRAAAIGSAANSTPVQWLLLTAALLILGGVMGLNTYSEHGSIDTSERERLATQARVIDENLGRQLRATNLALDSIRSDLPALKTKKDGNALINHRLHTMGEAMPGVRTLLILDATGTITASNREELIGQNYREREYFRIARERNDPALLHVSAPFTTGLGIFAMALLKVVPDERGAFGGLISATLDPEYFSILLESVRYAPDMWVSLAHGDGRLFLMIPRRPGIEGSDLNKPGSFRNRHLETGQKASVMTGIVHATGEERMMAQRIIRPSGVPMDKALGVAVARDLSTIFSTWRKDALIRAGLFGALVLVTTLGLHLYRRRQLAYDRLAAAQEAERARAQASLRQSEARFRQLLQDIPSVAVQGYGPDGTTHYWNRASERLYGYSADEAIGRKLLDLIIPPEMQQGVRAAMQQMFETGQPIPAGELSLLRKDGSRVEVFSSHAYAHVPGRAPEMFCVDIDLSERKRAEAEILRSNAELEQFSYSISHDMRQPLRMISSYLQLLELGLTGKLDAEQREYLNFAADGARRLDQMLVALLEYSRVGRKGEPPAWVESRALLDEALLYLQPAIAEARAQLRIDGDWPRIFASPDELLRLLQNLLGNALKFRIAGRTPEIAVSSHSVDQTWRFCVSDNGAGIIPDQIGRLFQVFQRLHNRAEYEGTGIGLALCRKIAEHHGGRIWVESPGAGRGSSFHVELPLAREAAAQLETALPETAD